MTHLTTFLCHSVSFFLSFSSFVKIQGYIEPDDTEMTPNDAKNVWYNVFCHLSLISRSQISSSTFKKSLYRLIKSKRLKSRKVKMV